MLQREDSFCRGFTLVELALVFLIAGFFFFIVSSTASSRIEAERIRTTNQRLAIIMKAIDQYARTYHHLPCPANPTLSIDNTSFGDGAGTNASQNSTSCTANVQHPAADNAPRGAVPTKQLSLNPRVAADGWDRKFTYVVTKAYTNVTGYIDASTAGAITITASGGATVTTTAAVAVISHGPNGFGGYVRDGSAVMPDSADTDELSNASNTATNNNDGYVCIFPMAGTSKIYDDIVEYRSRWQMVQP